MIEMYLRILEDEKRGNYFTFVDSNIHEILETDISITIEDYETWKEGQVTKNYRLKEVPTGTGLFDYIEEYDFITELHPPTESQKLRADVDYLAIMTGVEL